jgi:hypothetical protein
MPCTVHVCGWPWCAGICVLRCELTKWKGLLAGAGAGGIGFEHIGIRVLLRQFADTVKMK